MQTTLFQKVTLVLGGLIALAIGCFLLLDPQAFYASYGVALGTDPSLLSDLRAPGAGLASLGGIMLAGAWRAAWTPFALIAALSVYCAFPIGRIVSLVLDGMPSSGILGAFAIEVVIALLLLLAFGPRRKSQMHEAPNRL
ncbi:DUF4345 domain-containing protein [Cohaesibacter intestini]|uniref:DUF4345 domain-containing protein n=1 Tax=Cohaesibacter intestini TaxID=2211145 RepID=UPI000DE8F112|nr:DUF4345 domain-containing protein [Cohaesibacter intestini]